MFSSNVTWSWRQVFELESSLVGRPVGNVGDGGHGGNVYDRIASNDGLEVRRILTGEMGDQKPAVRTSEQHDLVWI